MNWRREEGIELEKFVMNGNMDSKKRYHPESFPRGKRQFPRYEAYRKHQEKENHCEEFAFCGVSLRTLEKEQDQPEKRVKNRGKMHDKDHTSSTRHTIIGVYQTMRILVEFHRRNMRYKATNLLQEPFLKSRILSVEQRTIRFITSPLFPDSAQRGSRTTAAKRLFDKAARENCAHEHQTEARLMAADQPPASSRSPAPTSARTSETS
jgi:hypothetical protein